MVCRDDTEKQVAEDRQVGTSSRKENSVLLSWRGDLLRKLMWEIPSVELTLSWAYRRGRGGGRCVWGSPGVEVGFPMQQGLGDGHRYWEGRAISI